MLECFLVPLALFGLLGFGIYFAKPPAPTVANSLLKVNYLDVGQGDSTLIQTPKNHFFLIDGGPDKSVLAALGNDLPPQNKEIEGLILSHPHADHVTGLNYVLDRYRVKKVFMVGTAYNAPEYQAFIEKIKELNIETIKIYQGYSFEEDDVKWQFLWPHKDEANAPNDINNDSAVLNVSYKSENFLFTGDLSEKMQDQMIKDLALPKIAVLKVSHHGSKTGTSQLLLEATKPDYAVISVGKNNTFGHPAPSVLAKLSVQKILRTDELGEIKFTTDGNKLDLNR